MQTIVSRKHLQGSSLYRMVAYHQECVADRLVAGCCCPVLAGRVDCTSQVWGNIQVQSSKCEFYWIRIAFAWLSSWMFVHWGCQFLQIQCSRNLFFYLLSRSPDFLPSWSSTQLIINIGFQCGFSLISWKLINDHTNCHHSKTRDTFQSVPKVGRWEPSMVASDNKSCTVYRVY
jgi:hypothetical protein